MKNLKLVFSCFILAFTLLSCGASFDREKFDKLIGTPIKEFFPSLKPSSPYNINVSEGRTETEKTLIVKYNNYINVLIGEEIMSEAEFAELWFDFYSFISMNGYEVRDELLEKISGKIKKYYIEKMRENYYQ